MLKKRVIPTLLYKDNKLVKGKNFLSDRPVSSVMESVKMYNIRGVDELIFHDIQATKKKRRTQLFINIRYFKRMFYAIGNWWRYNKFKSN